MQLGDDIELVRRWVQELLALDEEDPDDGGKACSARFAAAEVDVEVLLDLDDGELGELWSVD